MELGKLERKKGTRTYGLPLLPMELVNTVERYIGSSDEGPTTTLVWNLGAINCPKRWIGLQIFQNLSGGKR